jgi:hypothetical protein
MCLAQELLRSRKCVLVYGGTTQTAKLGWAALKLKTGPTPCVICVTPPPPICLGTRWCPIRSVLFCIHHRRARPCPQSRLTTNTTAATHPRRSAGQQQQDAGGLTSSHAAAQAAVTSSCQWCGAAIQAGGTCRRRAGGCGGVAWVTGWCGWVAGQQLTACACLPAGCRVHRQMSARHAAWT